jgi:hypothetical protein
MVNRLHVDLKDSDGEISGTIGFPADATFTLEAIALIIEHFQHNCEVPLDEIVSDICALLKD